ncbi:MAG TPA: Gfo/Idh/MocA family oxidoreductase [Tepidisphaeraceae bacterium]|nr:Gfo/Idh/MocA family oxidoreductase [Tepidisphaeraceae bacterium]
MSQRIRWGILGTGNIATQFAHGVSHSSRGELAAVGSRKIESASAFAKNNGIPTAHGSYDDLLRDHRVDAIYNSLPNSMHHEWTIKALRAGKHVLCEKPFARDAGESQEMFDVARQTGKTVAEAFMYRSNPLTLAVKKAVDGGAIGTPHLIRTSFCYRTNKIAGNIRFNRELAGGGLMDIGCYCINFARHFAGAEPSRVTASAHFHSSGVDDLLAGTMAFPSGLIASFTCGMIAQADNTAYLCGSDGFIEIPVPWKPPAVEAIYHIGRGIPPKMDGPIKPPAVTPRETVCVPIHGELYGMEADDFAAAVLDGAPPRVSEADTIGNMRVLDAIRREIKLEFST